MHLVLNQSESFTVKVVADIHIFFDTVSPSLQLEHQKVPSQRFQTITIVIKNEIDKMEAEGGCRRRRRNEYVDSFIAALVE